MPSIDELVAFFDGTSQTVCTLRWTPETLHHHQSHDALLRELVIPSIKWTTPTVRHELSVVPQQETTTTSAEVVILVTRAVCHMLIDQLPLAAFEELVPTLVDMRTFYSTIPGPAERHPELTTTIRPAQVLGRSVRPEVRFDEE
jgi:hypothetical protein